MNTVTCRQSIYHPYMFSFLMYYYMSLFMLTVNILVNTSLIMYLLTCTYTHSIVSLQKILDSIPTHSLPDLFTSIVKGSFKEKLEVSHYTTWMLGWLLLMDHVMSCDAVKVLDAVDLLDRYKAALPLVLRQIEVSRFLQITFPFLFYLVLQALQLIRKASDSTIDNINRPQSRPPKVRMFFIKIF